MKKLILAACILASLSACGGGGSEQTPASTQSSTSTVEATKKEYVFNATVEGTQSQVAGYGDNTKEAQYDAIAYIASTVAPGSIEQRKLLSNGLPIKLTYDSPKEYQEIEVYAIQKPNGLYIDLMNVRGVAK
jgi:hypothetical protein